MRVHALYPNPGFSHYKRTLTPTMSQKPQRDVERDKRIKTPAEKRFTSIVE